MLGIPFSLALDATGGGTLRLGSSYFRSDAYQVWTLTADVPGTGAQSTTVLVNGVIAARSFGSTPTLGPLYTKPGDQVSLIVSGATASATASGTIAGDENTNFADLQSIAGAGNPVVSIAGGSVSLAGPVTITGPVTVQQTDPSQLVTGGAGAALLASPNGTAVDYPSAVSTLNLTGYSHIMVGCNTGALASLRYFWFNDAAGTIPVGFSTLVNINPQYVDVLPVLAPFLRIHGSAPVARTFNLVIQRFTELPTTDLRTLLYMYGGAVGTVEATGMFVDISGAAAIAAGATANYDAVMVMPRSALLYFQTGAATVTVNVRWTDSSGVVHTMHSINPASAINGMPVAAVAGPYRISVVNGSAAAISPNGALMLHN